MQAGGQEFESLHLHLIIQRAAAEGLDRKEAKLLERSADEVVGNTNKLLILLGYHLCTLKTTYRKQIFYLILIRKTSEVVINRNVDKDLRIKLIKIDLRTAVRNAIRYGMVKRRRAQGGCLGTKSR